MSADDGVEAVDPAESTATAGEGLPPLVRGLVALLLLTVAAVFGIDLVEFATKP